MHEQFSARRIAELKAQWPDAEVIAHPECEGTVLELADFIGSTSALLARVQSSDARRFIVATEAGIIHQMQRAAPDKEYIPAPPDNQCACNVCDYMKVNTLEKLYLCMRDRTPEIVVPEEIRQRALPPIERMLALAQADDREAGRILATIRLPWSEA